MESPCVPEQAIKHAGFVFLEVSISCYLANSLAILEDQFHICLDVL